MIYLDNAATSFPKPEAVLRAADGVMRRLGGNPGRSGHHLSLAAGRIVMHCRETLARLLQVEDPTRICFCFNCTDALNQAIFGLLKQGDHVVATVLDHNASLRPLHFLSQQGVIDLTVLSPSSEESTVSASQVRDALRRNTALVVLSHASNVTGAVQPAASIGRVCRAAGIPFLLDAAQTLGVLPVHPKELGVSLLAFPGHKGLLGPYGTGGLWMDESVSLRPLRQGGTGSQSESVYQPEDFPDRFESGTLNLSGIAGLLQGVRTVLERQEETAAHEAQLSEFFLSGLAEIPGAVSYSPEHPSLGVVCFNLENRRSGEVSDALNHFGIAVRSGLHCAPLMHRHLDTLDTGTVRVSPGMFNTRRDMETLLSVLKRM